MAFEKNLHICDQVTKAMEENVPAPSDIGYKQCHTYLLIRAGNSNKKDHSQKLLHWPFLHHCFIHFYLMQLCFQ